MDPVIVPVTVNEPDIMVFPLTSSLAFGVVVPIPTLPLSNTTNDADAFEFSTLNAVDVNAEPDPRTSKRAALVELTPILTPAPEYNTPLTSTTPIVGFCI